MSYTRRLVDDLLDEFFPHMTAVALEGAKGVGKTATALERVRAAYDLDDPRQRQIIASSPHLIDDGPFPLLIDEWQLHPPVWDAVRRSVDRDRAGGRFLLAGSADVGPGVRVHSGAGRIDTFLMRPLSLAERGVTEPTISLGALLSGQGQSVSGRTQFRLSHYVDEIYRSGFPGIRDLPERVVAQRLRAYMQRIVEKELPESGKRVRRPQAVMAWLRAYAAATASNASYEAILDAATAGEANKPAQETVQHYRELLHRMFVVDPLEPWHPTMTPLKTLTQQRKHHLVDPALAAVSVGIGRQGLLRGESTAFTSQHETWLGSLFESLVVQSVRTYAQNAHADTWQLRTKNGRQEIDIIVEDWERNVVAIEVKLSGGASDSDVKHLNWLERQLGEHRHVEKVIVNTGQQAYRRHDGVAVVPFALLGP